MRSLTDEVYLNMITTILFDLDGTLTDSGPGIKECVHYALKKMGRPDCDEETAARFIGPPLLVSFREFCGFSEEESIKATALYREKYVDDGLFNNVPYPGIENCLGKLKDAGLTLAVCTSKPQNMAERVLDYFDLTKYFDHIVGPKKEGNRADKLEVLTEALELTGHTDDKDTVVLVGDRKYDAMGAALVGIECIGAAYGYAEKGELEEYGVKEIASDTAELTNILLKKAGR